MLIIFFLALIVPIPTLACRGLPGFKQFYSKCDGEGEICSIFQCQFASSGLLINKSALNKEAYKKTWRQWVVDNDQWSAAVEKSMSECVDKDPEKTTGKEGCIALEVFTCIVNVMNLHCPRTEDGMCEKMIDMEGF